MNMDGCEFIHIVTKEDEECFLLTKLRNGGKDGFELSLCSNGQVWTGEVSEDDLDTLSTKLKMTFDKYVKQTVEALTSLQEGREAFQFQLKHHGDDVNFIWKKHVPEKDVTYQLGSAALKARKDSTQLITLMFNHCIDAMRDLKERIHSLETDNERLSQERINALKRLEKCVVAKEELEQDLYSKFSLVLNSKKEKIRQLKAGEDHGKSDQHHGKIMEISWNFVEEGDAKEDQNESPDEAPAVSNTQTKRSRSQQESTLQSNRDSDVDTDDEKPMSKRQKSSKAKTSPQKSQASLADESLDLGHDDEDACPISRPRRQRGRQQKKQTPSKPVLPRIGSNESQSERKTPLRKRGSSNSNASNRSSDNIDADDLIGQL